jgi:hypothetical protein
LTPAAAGMVGHYEKARKPSVLDAARPHGCT